MEEKAAIASGGRGGDPCLKSRDGIGGNDAIRAGEGYDVYDIDHGDVLRDPPETLARDRRAHCSVAL
jgi:hypothetical protein